MITNITPSTTTRHSNNRVQHVIDLLAEHGRGFHLGAEYPAKLRTPGKIHVLDLLSPTGHPITKLHITAGLAELACPNPHHPKHAVIPALRVTPDTAAAELGAWCRRAARVAVGPRDALDRLTHLGLHPDAVPTPPEGVLVDGVRVRVLERPGDRWAIYVEGIDAPARWPKAPKGEQDRWPVAPAAEADPEAEPKHIKAVSALDPIGSEGVWTIGKYGAVRWATEQPTWGKTGRIPDAPALCPEPGAWAPLCPVMVSALGTAVETLGKGGAAVRNKPSVITICGPDWSTDVGGVGTCPDTGLPLGRYSAPFLAAVIRAVRATEIGQATPATLAVRGPKGTAWLMARTA